MTKNNKISASVLALGALLLGGAGSIAFQAHAQSSQVATTTGTIIQASVPSTAGTVTPATTDTDNNQDPGGIEKPDQTVEKSGSENLGDTQDAKGDLPGGHEDGVGTVDHQFDGNE